MTTKEDVQKVVCPDCGEAYGSDVEYCPKDGASLLSRSPESAADPLLGEKLDGRFRIDEILGEGGMGKVYRGRQMSVEREVAVKVIRAELYDDETAVQRFFREARVISRLSHPNVVNGIDFGRDEATDALYFAMELIDGFPLGEVLAGERASADLVVEVGKQTCSALSEPHSNGVAHRDLKPDNLMIVPMADGQIQVKVVDFGLAQAFHDEADLTKTGAVHGTPMYMSPEQARGADVEPASDLYSLGLILYEMLSGELPFEGEASMEILMKHVQESPKQLGDEVPVGADVPGDLIDLIDKLLEKEPSDRYEGVVELRKGLERLEEIFDLGPVRVDPEAPDVEKFDPWLGANESVAAMSGENRVRPKTDDQMSAYETDQFAERAKGPTSQPGGTADAAEPSQKPDRSADQSEVPSDRSGPVADASHSTERSASGTQVGDDSELLEERTLLVASLVLVLLAGGAGAGVWWMLQNKSEKASSAGNSEVAEATADASTGGKAGAAKAVARAGGPSPGSAKNERPAHSVDATAGDEQGERGGAAGRETDAGTGRRSGSEPTTSSEATGAGAAASTGGGAPSEGAGSSSAESDEGDGGPTADDGDEETAPKGASERERAASDERPEGEQANDSEGGEESPEPRRDESAAEPESGAEEVSTSGEQPADDGEDSSDSDSSTSGEDSDLELFKVD